MKLIPKCKVPAEPTGETHRVAPAGSLLLRVPVASTQPRLAAAAALRVSAIYSQGNASGCTTSPTSRGPSLQDRGGCSSCDAPSLQCRLMNASHTKALHACTTQTGLKRTSTDFSWRLYSRPYVVVSWDPQPHQRSCARVFVLP